MTTMVTFRGPRAMTAPLPEKLAGTILDAAVAVEDGIEWLEPDGGLYQTYNCMSVDSLADMSCPPPDPYTKEFQTAEWVNGSRFAVYGGVTCQALGFDPADAKRNLDRVFALREHIGIEKHIMGSIFTGEGPLDPAPVLTATAQKPDIALGMLEADAAGLYAGKPTLHMSRLTAVVLMNRGLIQIDGDKFLTKTGCPVAAGGGYGAPNMGPDGDPAGAGESWIYASGGVTIRRGKVREVPPQLNRVTNDYLVLTERIYVVAVDCYLSAVKASIT